MKLSRRRLWLFGAIAILIVLVGALLPVNNQPNSGSTYSRAPSGYGAWYAYIAERETSIQRLEKPFEGLVASEDTPVTLLRVYSSLTPVTLSQAERDWVRKGNTLVILGVNQPVTAASFSTRQNSAAGKVKIDTRRRAEAAESPILGDAFGAVVWEEKIGQGQVILATTPDLAANAYQSSEGNYELLAQLVRGDRQPVWVDEYLHGYRDAESVARETGNLISYLTQTPLFVALIQGLIILLVAVWAGSRRFGLPLTPSTPTVNNSEAYIQALAGVLQKADSTEFVVSVVGEAEQRQLQKALGLGNTLSDRQALIDAWVEQTGRSARELEWLLAAPSCRRLSKTQLLTWIDRWNQIRQPK